MSFVINQKHDKEICRPNRESPKRGMTTESDQPIPIPKRRKDSGNRVAVFKAVCASGEG